MISHHSGRNSVLSDVTTSDHYCGRRHNFCGEREIDASRRNSLITCVSRLRQQRFFPAILYQPQPSHHQESQRLDKPPTYQPPQPTSLSHLQTLLAQSTCNRFLAASLDVSITIECRWVSGNKSTANANTTQRATRRPIHLTAPAHTQHKLSCGRLRYYMSTRS